MIAPLVKIVVATGIVVVLAIVFVVVFVEVFVLVRTSTSLPLTFLQVNKPCFTPTFLQDAPATPDDLDAKPLTDWV